MNEAEFDVIITQTAGNKLHQKVELMKAIMAVNPIGLRRAKDIVDNPPGIVLESVSQHTARKAKKTLEAAGATVELRASKHS